MWAYNRMNVFLLIGRWAYNLSVNNNRDSEAPTNREQGLFYPVFWGLGGKQRPLWEM